MGLTENIKTIKTRADLVSFVHELRKDLHSNSKTWTNKDLETFLNAMAAWIDDMEGYYQNQGLPVPEEPEWKTIADILMAAKLYE